MLTSSLRMIAPRLPVALLTILFCAASSHSTAAQNSKPGAVTGVIDGVSFEGDQYFVHGWACQEGNRGSISINIYATHPAGAKPPGRTAAPPSP